MSIAPSPDDIPCTFQRPSPTLASVVPTNNDDHDENDSDLFTNLFQENDGEKDAEPALQIVSIAGLNTFYLRLPPDVETLFAHCVWSGSKILAEFLAHNQSYVLDQTTIELGAGTALPSLAALARGSRYSVITDYPNHAILRSLRETVEYNWRTCHCPTSRVAVVGHQWGTSIQNIRDAVDVLRKQQQQQQDDTNEPFFFNVAFLSECLWMHRSHADLLQSLHCLLHPQTGRAIVTYAHHVPGHEAADNAFFTAARTTPFCFDIVHESSYETSYMWNEHKSMVVYLKVLARRQPE